MKTELGKKYLEGLKKRDGQQYDKENGACLQIEPVSIGKDTDGDIGNMHDLHGILLDIILEVDRICRKHDIPYALAFGSALGIYNYKGFIPWDDDADVVIKYEDINRFIKAMEEDLGEEFALDCYEKDDRYTVLIPTMKIRYKNSYIKEFNQLTLPNKCRNGDGVFIDICAFMDVPDNQKEHKKLLKYSKHRIAPYFILDTLFHINPIKLKNRIKAYEKKIFEKYHNKTNSVAQTVIIPWQDYKMPLDSISCPRDVIYPFKEYDFEGHKIYSFNNVEEFCRIWFKEKAFKQFIDGEWRDPYPLNKRKLEHIKKYNFSKKQ